MCTSIKDIGSKVYESLDATTTCHPFVSEAKKLLLGNKIIRNAIVHVAINCSCRLLDYISC